MASFSFDSLQINKQITTKVYNHITNNNYYVAKVLDKYIEDGLQMVKFEITIEEHLPRNHPDRNAFVLRLSREFSTTQFQPLPHDFYQNLTKYPYIRLRYDYEHDGLEGNPEY
jgi:hypothetical protein